MAVVIMLAVRVEAKEDDTGEGVHPYTATPDELASYAGSLLNDETRRDGQIGWRTTEVTASGAVPA